MKRLLAAALLFILACTPPALASGWQGVAQRVERSLVSLKDLRGAIYCTGFVIDDKRDFVMTAEHCAEYGAEVGIQVDRKNGWTVWSEPALDVAVLQVPGISAPALAPSRRPLARGQEVGAFGFGWGMRSGMFRQGQVSHPAVWADGMPDARTETTPWVMFNFSVVPGMSGGPVVDTDGRVVSINQVGNAAVSMGKSIELIEAVSGDFWEKR